MRGPGSRMSLFAVVPVKDLRETKSRLGPVLAPDERAGLTLRTMDNVLSALREAGVENVCVVSPDRRVLQAAGESGATRLFQDTSGLNPALEGAREWAVSKGATSLLVLPADLPFLDAQDIREMLERDGEEHQVVISPDEGYSGTNALLLRPPDSLPFAFGPESYREHVRLAEERGITVNVCERPNIAFDLDTVRDLERLKS